MIILLPFSIRRNLLESANLKQTSLYSLGQKLLCDPGKVTQYYIEKGGLMSNRLIGYQSGRGFLYNLSRTSKMLFFILVSVACMAT